MLHKRSRAAYEADSHAAETPFVAFGTPFGPLDSGLHDDGSFVPIHKQEVRDQQGRRRLHGALTGGWSAGYFNTVGSKEGWTPSTFLSSRQGRRTDESSARHGQRPEDFMDDEDLADVADSSRIQTTDSFAGLGGRSQAQPHTDGLAGLVNLHGYTMGFTLLRKMGWRDGQGIGPKIRRPARLHDDENHRGTISAGETHLFAPDDITVVKITRKLDRAGLGAELASHGIQEGDSQTRPLEDVTEGTGGIGHVADAAFLSASFKKPKRKPQGGIGIGVLNDTGSDDEDDPYSMGPRISLNRSLGGSKSKRGKKPGNPALAAKLTFTSRPSLLPQTMTRTCQDGRPPLPGFVLASGENFAIPSAMSTIFQPPPIPPDWTSSKGLKPIHRGLPNGAPGGISKTLIYNPGSRAAALGEAPLPGKSVFDFMSAESRARLVAASGNTNLPRAKGEIPPDFAASDEQKIKDGIQGLPFLEKETAIAAIRRGHGVGGPYADDESRQSRFRAFLEHFAFGSPMPAKPDTMTAGGFVKELAEFHNCAKLFKPMTGFMATRFTVSSSSALSPGVGNTGRGTVPILSGAPVTQRQDPAEEAANMGLYGHLTRSIVNFYPTRLLCKRFNVRQPNDVAAHSATEAHIPLPVSSKDGSGSSSKTERPARQEGQDSSREAGGSPAHANDGRTRTEPQRPADDVFKAVFGDSDDDVLD